MYNNKLWYQQINSMRTAVGGRGDEEALSRTFCNGFEYLFGNSDDNNDSDLDDTKPLLAKKKVTFSYSTIPNRSGNSTFSSTDSTATVFKPKLNFISTKDVLKVMIDGSKDFCNSKVRSRSRVLHRPEMWDRIVEVKESVSGPEYECLIYQLLEFRVIYEYINGGAGGEPFSNVRKAHPTDSDKWLVQEKVITEMEEGSSASTVPATPEDIEKPVQNSGPKKTRKKRLLEKIAHSTVSQSASIPTTQESEVESSSGEEVAMKTKEDDVIGTLVNFCNDEAGDEDDWIEVGTDSKTKKRDSASPVEDTTRAPSLAAYSLSKPHQEYSFPGWRWCSKTLTYEGETCRAISQRTFLEVIPYRKQLSGAYECPF
jgi:hypothetical protein